MVISLRYNVIGAYSTGEQERIYNTVAESIAKSKIKQLAAALGDMRSIYIEDRRFRPAFAEKSIRTSDTRNNKVVRFILCALEKHLSGQENEFSSATFNVEHVLPQNVPDNWGCFSNEEQESLVFRVGNMTLMQSGQSREAGVAEFEGKRALYQSSDFEITRKLTQENTEWTPERIAARQNWMADQATCKVLSYVDGSGELGWAFNKPYQAGRVEWMHALNSDIALPHCRRGRK